MFRRPRRWQRRHAARLVAIREAAFDQLPRRRSKLLPYAQRTRRRSRTPPAALRAGLASGAVPSASVPECNWAPLTLHPLDYRTPMIAFVRHQLSDPLGLIFVHFLRFRSDPTALRRPAVASRSQTPSPAQKLLVTLGRVSPHDRAHRPVRLQGDRFDPQPLAHSAVSVAPAIPASTRTPRHACRCAIKCRVREIVECFGVRSSSPIRRNHRQR